MRIVTLILLLLATACSVAPEPISVPAFRAEITEPLRVKAVMVGAESSIKAFDNATDRFSKSLTARVGPNRATIARFSNRPIPETERSEIPGVLRAIEAMQAGPNESCLIFVTGHGIQDRGVAFPRSKDYLRQNALDRAIAQGCGNRPTVVVISACFSGGYTTGPVARDNRIVLTAARRDRPSFGCGVQNNFTYFDGCFLSGFEDKASTTWEDVARSAIACVGSLERTDDFEPSEPQLYVGRTVVGLKLPGV